MEELKNVPTEETLVELKEPIDNQKNIIKSQKELWGKISEEINNLDSIIKDKENIFHDKVNSFEVLKKEQRKIIDAEKTQKVIKSFQETLIKNKMASLEENILSYFNNLCSKEKLILSISINRNNFEPMLKGVSSSHMLLSDFSKGERQLYSLAVLWALRKIINRELPLVIDTPLASLDGKHQKNLWDNYFPQVSKQSILFTIDSELDKKSIEQYETNISKSYELVFDKSLHRTQINYSN